MKRRNYFLQPVAFMALFLFITGLNAKAQCTIYSYNALKALWTSDSKEDKLMADNFDKRSGNTYARCKMTMCSTEDSVSKNYNEFVFIYDDEVMYSFTDREAYLKLKTLVKTKASYAGMAMFDDIKREYYFDGKICYCFYVGMRNCLSKKINDYNVGFLEKVPSYVKEKEE